MADFDPYAAAGLQTPGQEPQAPSAAPPATPFDPYAAAGLQTPSAASMPPANAPPDYPFIGPTAIRQYGLGTRAMLGVLPNGQGIANAFGLPIPGTAPERIASGMVGGTTGALGGAALASGAAGSAAFNPTTQAIARVLAAQPVRQAVVGGLAGGAQAMTQALGLPKWAQIVSPYAVALASAFVPGSSSPVAGAEPVPGVPLAAADDATVAAVAKDKYGIPIEPDDWLYRTLSKFPFTGGEGFLAKKLAAWQTAVGRTFGAEAKNGKLIGDPMQGAADNISGVYNRVAENTTVPMDDTLLTRLANTSSNAKDSLPSNEAQPIQNTIDSIIDRANKNGDVVPSDWLIDTLGAKSDLSANAGSGSAASHYWQDIHDGLSEALERNASDEDKADLGMARQQWKYYKTVQPVVSKGWGELNPTTLANAVANNKFLQNASGGAGDLGDLAVIGKRFMKGAPGGGMSTGHAAEAAVGAEIGQKILDQFGMGPLGHAIGGTTATLAAGAPIATRLMRMGALQTAPVTANQYYARALMNPSYLQSPP